MNPGEKIELAEKGAEAGISLITRFAQWIRKRRAEKRARKQQQQCTESKK